jgi:uncharacterized OB-fold protein
MKTIHDEFFSEPRDDIGTIHLRGSACRSCGEVFLGTPHACANCQSEALDPIPLGRDGTLYSYTIVRNQPPGDYKGGVNPFVPYPVGLVELPEGVRILCRVDAPFDALKIGIPLRLSVCPYYHDTEGKEVLSYTYAAAGAN